MGWLNRPHKRHECKLPKPGKTEDKRYPGEQWKCRRCGAIWELFKQGVPGIGGPAHDNEYRLKYEPEHSGPGLPPRAYVRDWE